MSLCTDQPLQTGAMKDPEMQGAREQMMKGENGNVVFSPHFFPFKLPSRAQRIHKELTNRYF